MLDNKWIYAFSRNRTGINIEKYKVTFCRFPLACSAGNARLISVCFQTGGGVGEGGTRDFKFILVGKIGKYFLGWLDLKRDIDFGGH